MRWGRLRGRSLRSPGCRKSLQTKFCNRLGAQPCECTDVRSIALLICIIIHRQFSFTCLWGWRIFEKNITTLENASIPLFGELLKFTAHGRNFERWWYTAFLVVWYRPRNWTLLLMSLLKLLRMSRLEMSKSDRWDDTTNSFVLYSGQHVHLPAVLWESQYPYVSDVSCVPVCGSLWGHVLL